MQGAPDFPVDATWFNASHAPSLGADLAGHVVVLHFWTASSVHCRHSLQAMSFVEQRFAGRAVAVIGVHSGRLPGERTAARVRDAVLELGIRHPVVVDAQSALFREYQCHAWPTIVLIDASGMVRFNGAGEADRDRLAAAVDALLEEGRERGAVSGEPFGVEPRYLAVDDHRGPWRFPSAFAIDAERGWLWVADAGCHRLVAVDIDSGALQRIVGSGAPGFADGGAQDAAFFAPSGLAVHEDRLFVADTGNHAIRCVDVNTGSVETFAGNGRAVRDRVGGHCGVDQGLLSPRGLAVLDGALYVAMAGTHQLWRIELDTALARAVAGNGNAQLVDGSGCAASLAQPCGLAAFDGELAFVDADSGSLRLFAPASGVVRTLFGGGGESALQHPLDVVEHDGDLLIADSLNGAVQRWRRQTGSVEICLRPADGLVRPAALARHADTLFVADARRVWRCDLSSGAVAEMEVTDLAAVPDTRAEQRTARLRLRAMSDVTLRVPIVNPAGERPHPDVPMRMQCENVEGHPLIVAMELVPVPIGDHAVVYGLPFADEGEGAFRFRLSWLSCTDRDAVCHPHELRRLVPVVLDAHGDGDVTLAD